MTQRNLWQWAVAFIAIVLLIIRHIEPSWDVANIMSGGMEWILAKVIFDVTTGVLLIIVLCPWWLKAIFSAPHNFIRLRKVSQSAWLKLLISIIALIVLAVHTVQPGIEFDYLSLALLIMVMLPWLTSLIESAKFPGGWEVKFRDIKEAGERITGNELKPSQIEAPAPSFISVAQEDPNLAIVGLRIEIEKRIRERAERHKIKEQRSLSRMSNELRAREVLDTEEMYGLQELIYAGNQAAHGASVERKVADWAIEYGPIVLGALDRKIAEATTNLSISS